MQTFTPSGSQYRRYILTIIPLLVILLIIDYFRLREDPVPFLVIVLAAGILVLGYLTLYFRNTRVEGQDHSLEVRDFLGRTRTLSYDQLDRVVLLHLYTQAGSRGGIGPRLIVLDPQGKSVLTWSFQFWTFDQMQTLAAVLGITVDDIPDPVSTRQLKARYPNSINWVQAHPYLFSTGVAVIIVIAIVVIIGAVAR